MIWIMMLALTLIAVGHILRVIVYHLNGKEEMKIDIKPELAGLLLWIVVFAIYGLFDL